MSVPFLFLLSISCIYNHTATTENLGSGYFYIGDGQESQILSGDEKKNSGITIIPQEVIEYNFDNRYIIAKSIENRNLQQYWIVDKQSHESVSPLDSLSFAKEIKRLKIDLKLKSRK